MGLDAPEMEDETEGGCMKKNMARYALIIPALMLLFTASCAKKEAPKPVEKPAPAAKAPAPAPAAGQQPGR